MGSTQKFLREVRELVEKQGMTVLDVQQNKHLKLRIQTPHGPRCLVLSVSASDQRTMHHVERDIRHLKERGVS